MHPQLLPERGALPATEAPATPGDTAGLTGTVPEAPGCAEGGVGVHTPEDVRCYLDQFDARLVRMVDEDIAVLITPADSTAGWIGGAMIYHIPTVSSVTLDFNGYVDPQWTSVNSRTAWNALFSVLFDEALMEELRQAVADEWQLPDPEEVTLKLGIAYQKGSEVVFLWSFAGLDAEDDTFYCTGERWCIGDIRMESIPGCAEYEPPTERLGQMEHQLEQAQQTVQLSVGGLQSNELVVVVDREG
jgi:hypothetical protein